MANGRNMTITFASETRQPGGRGHSSLFRDKEGDLRIVFHAHHDENNIHPRKMYIGRLGFKPDGEVDKLYIEEEYEIPVLKK